MKLTLLLLTFSVFGFAQEPSVYIQKLPGDLGNILYKGPINPDNLIIFVTPGRPNTQWVAIEGTAVNGDTKIEINQVHLVIPGLGAVFMISLPNKPGYWTVTRKITQLVADDSWMGIEIK